MPRVSAKRIQRGSVHRSICGPRAVVMPKARYSSEASWANCFTTSGSKHAAKPTPSGHLLTSLPTVLNSTMAFFAPLRGSEEMFTGIAWGRRSAICCRLLLHRAAVAASSTATIRIWRMRRCSKNSSCWSDRACFSFPDSSQVFPSNVPPNGAPWCGGTIWCGEYSISPAISSGVRRDAKSFARSSGESRQSA